MIGAAGSFAACAPPEARTSDTAAGTGLRAQPVAGSGTTNPDGRPRRVVVNGVDLTGIGHDRGSATASVVLVNFSDFGCPYCGVFARETQPALEKEYVESGKVFVKYVPFVMGMFPNGGEAARAAECAGEQGAFWAMHDRLYEKQPEWKKISDPDPLLKRYAAALRLDATRFAACSIGGGLHARTAAATGAAEQLGVRVTPSFAVNGRGIEGALPLAQFRQLFDAALAGAP